MMQKILNNALVSLNSVHTYAVLVLTRHICFFLRVGFVGNSKKNQKRNKKPR